MSPFSEAAEQAESAEKFNAESAKNAEASTNTLCAPIVLEIGVGGSSSRFGDSCVRTSPPPADAVRHGLYERPRAE